MPAHIDDKISISFFKIEGCGNDFIAIEKAQLDGLEPQKIARKVCDRKTGIGADGLLIYAFMEGGFSMSIFNSDGSEAENCGNALRSFAHLAGAKLGAGKELKIQNKAGRFSCGSGLNRGYALLDWPKLVEKRKLPEKFRLSGPPLSSDPPRTGVSGPPLSSDPPRIGVSGPPLSSDPPRTGLSGPPQLSNLLKLPDNLEDICIVDAGVPHGVIHQFSFSGRHPGFHGSGHPVPMNPQREMMNHCRDLPLGEHEELQVEGLAFDFLNKVYQGFGRDYPGGINLNLLLPVDEKKALLFTLERGAGPTRACGTGAASAFAVLEKYGPPPAQPFEIWMPGGSLFLSRQGDKLEIDGPASIVFQGFFES